jgi:hypothetical protein
VARRASPGRRSHERGALLEREARNLADAAADEVARHVLREMIEQPAEALEIEAAVAERRGDRRDESGQPGHAAIVPPRLFETAG